MHSLSLLNLKPNRMKNSVTLIGNVGSDPIMRSTESNKKVCNLSLATSEKWRDEQNVLHEKTQWHHLVIWGKQAETAATYIQKGNRLAIDGRIEYREFTDKEGNKRYSTDIVVTDFYLLTPKAS